MKRCCKCSAQAMYFVKRDDEEDYREVCLFHFRLIIRFARRDGVKYYTNTLNFQ